MQDKQRLTELFWNSETVTSLRAFLISLGIAAVLGLVLGQVYVRFGLYVDSPSRRAYLEHVNGASDRVKTRLRWYGQFSGQIDRSVLERKLKCGLVSGKIAFPLPGFHVNGGLALGDLEGVLDRAGLLKNLRLTLDDMEPAVVVRRDSGHRWACLKWHCLFPSLPT